MIVEVEDRYGNTSIKLVGDINELSGVCDCCRCELIINVSEGLRSIGKKKGDMSV